MSDDDRRRHRRISTSVRVNIGQGEGAQSGETRDVSEGGLGLVTGKKLERGSQVSIEVLLGGAPASAPGAIKTMATVMWSAETDTGAYTAGLKFDGASAEAVERLRRFLAATGEDE
jgi:c-di-GMP-binding flagellar brake protein YcgR